MLKIREHVLKIIPTDIQFAKILVNYFAKDNIIYHPLSHYFLK